MIRRFVIAIVAASVAMRASPLIWNVNAESDLRDPSSKWLLFLEKDEKSVEAKIAQYLAEVKKIKYTEEWVGSDKQDLIIRVHYTLDSKPDIHFQIDTAPSASDLSERRISVRAWHVLPRRYKTNSDLLKKIRELNEKYARQYFAPHQVYLDSDNDIMMACHVNVPARDIPVHAEQIINWMSRMLQVWAVYFSEFRKTVGDPFS